MPYFYAPGLCREGWHSFRMQHETYNMQQSMRNMQHETYNMQQSMRNMQHATYNMQQPMRNM